MNILQLAAGLIFLFPAVSATPTLPPQINATSTIQVPDKIDSVIDGLIKCESGGNPLAVGDSGKARGILQFWPGTFLTQMKKYKLLPDAEDKEIMNFYTDSDMQRRLARKMLEDDMNNLRHWTNCGKRLGLL